MMCGWAKVYYNSNQGLKSVQANKTNKETEPNFTACWQAQASIGKLWLSIQDIRNRPFHIAFKIMAVRLRFGL